MDCFQPSGSFKIRGMENIVRFHMSEGRDKFIGSSGGNAGLSLAYVGNILKASVKIVVPEPTPEFMIEKIKTLGAEVVVFGKSWNETDKYTRELEEKENLTYISPFNHPKLWEGHSTIIDECAEKMPEPDKVVVAVGGGGLLIGIMQGMKRNNWNKASIVTCETEGAASFLKSYEADKLETLEEINTIANSLGANRVAQEALDYSRDYNIIPHICSDLEALDACEGLYREFNVLVEPACGAALSYPELNNDFITESENVLVIVCGGVGMDFEKYQTFKTNLDV